MTEPNLRFPAVFCENLRFPAKICGFLRFPAPSKCLNFQEKGWICENLRFSAKICVLGSLCHLSSVPLSAPWQKWLKSDSGRPTPKWPKSDSKVTPDPIFSSHFWVTFESLGNLKKCRKRPKLALNRCSRRAATGWGAKSLVSLPQNPEISKSFQHSAKFLYGAGAETPLDFREKFRVSPRTIWTNFSAVDTKTAVLVSTAEVWISAPDTQTPIFLGFQGIHSWLWFFLSGDKIFGYFPEVPITEIRVSAAPYKNPTDFGSLWGGPFLSHFWVTLILSGFL